MRKTMTIMGLAILTSSVLAQPESRQKVAAPKPAAQHATVKKSPSASNKSVSRTAKPVAEAPLGQEELSIAQRVHHGRLPCELGAAVRVEPDHQQPGYFNVQGKGFHYRMHPVATSTGAIRLEDKQAGAVWLQLANKSMLMDQKKGQRLADECAHPAQVAFAEEMKNNPPPPLIEVNTGR